MKLLDSRRLTGGNVVLDRPGAVVDVALEPDETSRALAGWRRQARRILDAVGWTGERVYVREFSGGASLAISAPIDALYAACEVNEWAVAATQALLETEAVPALEEDAAHLRALIERESRPRLLALRDAAATHGVAFTSDDEQATVGIGRGSRSWPVDALPDAEEVDWGAVHDVPVALITGTNGKTTTTRMLATIAARAGMTTGNTSSDGVQIGGKIVLPGDYTGGEGARTVLRDSRVDIAILEAARGGLLRRGLPVARADAAMVTNVGADHLGEFGVADLDELADTKMIVCSAVDRSGHVVLNADDPALVARADRVAAPIVWIGLDPDADLVREHLERGGEAWLLVEGALTHASAGARVAVMQADEIPVTLGGAAIHNVYNALGALALAAALGLPREAAVEGLRAFDGTADDNPGRGNLFECDGARLYVDFAHNPDGVRAVVEMARRLRPERLLVIIGQAGDRDDESIRGLARSIWAGTPDRVVVKEMERYLRGRESGEVPGMIVDELGRQGAPEEAIVRAASELDAVRAALDWSRPGDLLLVLLHERTRALEHIRARATAGWSSAS